MEEKNMSLEQSRFMMTKEAIEAEIAIINEYLGKCAWMDFTFGTSHGGLIELFGAIDQTYNNYVDNYEIRIEFTHPHFISSLYSWTSGDIKPFIQLASATEEYRLKKKYQVEWGNYLFKIGVDGFDKPPIFIGAKTIKCIILNEKPF